MPVRGRSSCSRMPRPSGDNNRRKKMAATSAVTSTDRFKWLFSARNNSSGTQQQNRESRPQLKPQSTAAVAGPEGQSATIPIRHSKRVSTYFSYLKLRKEALEIEFEPLSGKNTTEDDKASVVEQQPLSTFAENQMRDQSTTDANKRTSGRHSLTNIRSSQTDMPDIPRRKTSAKGSVNSDMSTVGDKEIGEIEDTNVLETDDEESNGKCGCCSRVKRDFKDSAERRRRHLINQEERSDEPSKKPLRNILDEDADLADMKDTDPTITLMPYVLFESERHKVLYQSVGMDQAELLKRAIALHANSLYKHMLMKLTMARYLKLICETVVRTILSKKVPFFLDSDGLAVNLMGIEIAAEESNSPRHRRGKSKSISLRELPFNSPGIELSQFRSSQLTTVSANFSRDKFKSAPRFTDTEALQLLNDGKVLDITGRASLESLVSLPTARFGQKKSL